MTDDIDATRRTREPFDDPVTGDQTLPERPPGRVPGADAAVAPVAGSGALAGLPGEMLAKPDPSETPPGQSEAGREADADAATIGR